ncbi:transcriptional repressor [Panacibacter sp. DH6]|uniref:Transcriptional repressor n=1 Tax=Panacibacter microcysteis TaxID=2793269 RepID=A0A931GYF6_9BACT|nr:transcriptional repressor [Panacibacter microcysteis]MBG9375747.1 transcriptional repressor [Panacibacter microcysteis]
MKNEVAEILKRNQLSVTESRRKILELFRASNGALAHADIETKTGEHFDRVTVYRTLQTFVDKGIIHTIPTADNSVRYALCKDACSEGHHHDNHVHFICDDCGTTYCLENIITPEVRLPQGFKQSQTDVVVSGVCDKCS